MSAKSVPVSRREDSEPSAGPGTSLGDGLCRLTSDRGDPGTPNLVSLGLPTLQVQYSTVQYSTVQCSTVQYRHTEPILDVRNGEHNIHTDF